MNEEVINPQEWSLFCCFSSESGLDDQLLDDLNAWDAKWVDQPDFSRRLSAFNRLGKMADDGAISVNLGVIAIYTCFHFIRSVSKFLKFSKFANPDQLQTNNSSQGQFLKGPLTLPQLSTDRRTDSGLSEESKKGSANRETG